MAKLRYKGRFGFYWEPEAIEFHLKEKGDVNELDDNKETPLICAVREGDLDLALRLLNKGANMHSNKICTSAMGVAIVEGRAEMVDSLIMKGFDVRKAGEGGITPLYLASSSKNFQIFKMIYNLDPRSSYQCDYGQSLLSEASQSGRVEVVKFLVDKGAVLDAADKEGRTALHAACWHNYHEIVEMLVNKGADVNAQTKWGVTPIMEAQFGFHKQVIEFLCNNGADLSLKDYCGRSVMHQSVRYVQKEGVEFFLDKGVDIDITDNMGRTPLHLACENGSVDVARFLLERGADVDAATKAGAKPYMFACVARNVELLKLLVENGATIDTSIDYLPKIGAQQQKYYSIDSSWMIEKILRDNIYYKENMHHEGQNLQAWNSLASLAGLKITDTGYENQAGIEYNVLIGDVAT